MSSINIRAAFLVLKTVEIFFTSLSEVTENPDSAIAHQWLEEKEFLPLVYSLEKYQKVKDSSAFNTLKLKYSDFIRKIIDAQNCTVVEYTKQQSILHMLNVLVERVVSGLPCPDPIRERSIGWRKLMGLIIEFIDFAGEPTGDTGVAEGVALAERLMEIFYDGF
jgi:hypothetical protein